MLGAAAHRSLEVVPRFVHVVRVLEQQPRQSQPRGRLRLRQLSARLQDRLIAPGGARPLPACIQFRCQQQQANRSWRCHVEAQAKAALLPFVPRCCMLLCSLKSACNAPVLSTSAGVEWHI
jgi:hypothetical protein